MDLYSTSFHYCLLPPRTESPLASILGRSALASSVCASSKRELCQILAVVKHFGKNLTLSRS